MHRRAHTACSSAESSSSIVGVKSNRWHSSKSSSSGLLIRFSSRTKRIFRNFAKPTSDKHEQARDLPHSQDLETFHFAWFETPPIEKEKERRGSWFARRGLGLRRTSSSSTLSAVESFQGSTPATSVQCSLELPTLPNFFVDLPTDENNDSLAWTHPDDFFPNGFPGQYQPPNAPRITCVDLPPFADPSTLDLSDALADRLASSNTRRGRSALLVNLTSEFSDWTPTVASTASLSSILPAFSLETSSRQSSPSPYRNVRTLFPARPSTLRRIDSGEEGWKTDKREEEAVEAAREALQDAFADLAEVRLRMAPTLEGERIGRTREVVGASGSRASISRGRSATRTTTRRRVGIQQLEIGAGD